MRWFPKERHLDSDMCPTVKLLLISILLAGVAVVSPTKGRAKRYAQEPQEPQGSSDPNLSTNPSPLVRFFNGVSDRYGRISSRLENRNSNSTNRYPLRDWISRIGQQRNGSLVLDGLLRRVNATWSQRFSSSNSTIPSRNIQLLRDLLHLRNRSMTDVRTRIDEFLSRIFSDLSQRLSGSNVTMSSRNLQELRELIHQRIEQHRNATLEKLERLLHRIDSILSQRNSEPGRIPPRSIQTSGGGSLSATGSIEHRQQPGGIATTGNPETSGEGSLSTSRQSGSASGSGESGDLSGGASSGSGESGGSS